jgi:hypothetical protein
MEQRAITAHHGYAARAELAGLADQGVRQVRMRAQQVVHRPGCVARHLVVGLPGVLHFLNVFGWPPDRFAVDDISHLAQCELVAFHGGRGVHREDAVAVAQL